MSSALKRLCEARQEPLHALAGIGKRFQGDEQQFSGRPPLTVLSASAHSKIAGGRVIGRAKIDASNLRPQELGKKRDAAAHRLLAQRVSPAPADRRQDEPVEQPLRLVRLGHNDCVRSPDVDSAAASSLELALVLKPRQVPSQCHRGDAAAAVDKRLQRNNASLLEQR